MRRFSAVCIALAACGARTTLDDGNRVADATTPEVAVPDAPFATACDGVSLLVNCSFEAPVIPSASLKVFSQGQSFEGWSVVGAPGNVNIISTTFTQNDCSFPAQDGAQSMDLTGFSNTPTGIAQDVATEVGATYHLSFWVGNMVDPNGVFGVTSKVSVQINGSDAFSAFNMNDSGNKSLAWEEFAFDFTATTATTTIAFVNQDSVDDSSNFIDDVLLARAPDLCDAAPTW